MDQSTVNEQENWNIDFFIWVDSQFFVKSLQKFRIIQIVAVTTLTLQQNRLDIENILCFDLTQRKKPFLVRWKFNQVCFRKTWTQMFDLMELNTEWCFDVCRLNCSFNQCSMVVNLEGDFFPNTCSSLTFVENVTNDVSLAFGLVKVHGEVPD